MEFERILDGNEPLEGSETIQSLLKNEPNNYLIIYGGHECGANKMKVLVLRELASFLSNKDNEIAKDQVHVSFINKNLSKQPGSFDLSLAPKKNELTFRLEEISFNKEVFAEKIYQEKKGKKILKISNPDQRLSSFAQFTFQMEGESEPRSFSLLVLRNYKKSTAPEDAFSSAAQQFVRSGISEFKEMMGSTFIGQEKIETIIRRPMEGAKVSVFMCVKNGPRKIQEMIFALSIYHNFNLAVETSKRQREVQSYGDMYSRTQEPDSMEMRKESPKESFSLKNSWETPSKEKLKPKESQSTGYLSLQQNQKKSPRFGAAKKVKI